MKKRTGFATVAGIAIALVFAILIGLGTWLVIDGNNKATNFEDYDFFSVIEPDVHNGNIGDHVKGDKNAPLLIFEYADFQCPGCAGMNPRINQLIEESNGKIAVVYRNYLLSYHQNGTAAASAAEAAGIQGYWKEYADILFANQSEWEYASGSERTELFNKYFLGATEGKGELEKFKQDVASAEVSKKISFDMGIGKRIDIPATPAFYIDGQYFDWSNENGSSIKVNGETYSWEKALTSSEFMDLIKKIAGIKAE